MDSCGSIVDILPEIIECGLDIINPVQVSARGIDPETLRSDVFPWEQGHLRRQPVDTI